MNLAVLDKEGSMAVKSLYPYQLEDVDELKGRPRIILGSVMRAGKMVETFELVKQLDLQNVLIVCPKPMIAEWHYNVIDWLGPEYELRFDIVNYAKLRRPQFVSVVQQSKYDLIVFDEAHKIKNRQAQQTKGAFLIGSFAKRIVLATGTPMENNPADLWSLLHIIDPKTFNSYWKFAERYCYIQQLPVPPYPRVIVGSKNKEELRELLGGYMLRREKWELKDHNGCPVVLDRLPERTIPVELFPEQMKKYKSMEDDLFVLLDNGEKVTAPAVIAQLTRLRQICLEPNLLSSGEKVSSPSAKTELVLELIEDADGPVVIFTYYEKYANILAEELRRNKISHALYTGPVDDYTKHKVKEDFQAGKYQALIGTIGSIGLGLTLTASHIPIFTDKFWNPQVNDQCISRLEGTGQSRPVQPIDLWAQGTVEDHMHHVLTRKLRTFRDVVVTEQEVLAETIESMRRARGG